MLADLYATESVFRLSFCDSRRSGIFPYTLLSCLPFAPKVYPYCEKWALSWNWRKHLIMKALLGA